MKKYFISEKFTRNTVIISTILSIIFFVITRSIALSVRGTEYLGGEMVILLIPFMIWATLENLKLESDYETAKRKKKHLKRSKKKLYSKNYWDNTIKIDKINKIEVVKEW